MSETAAAPPRAPLQRRLIVLTRKTGQLGNRLIVAAHLIGAAREAGWHLWNPSFVEYARYFVGPSAALLRYDEMSDHVGRARSQVLRSLIYPLARMGYASGRRLQDLSGGRMVMSQSTEKRRIDLAELLEALPESCRLLLLKGFTFRHDPWCLRQAPFIRQFFMPLPQYREAGERAIAGLRARARHVIGVHIRHGDYRNWRGGRYFYEIDCYLALMDRIRELLGGDVAFLICSDERQDRDVFSSFLHAWGTGRFIEDLHALSHCDYVVGPPSSFSLWAAFHGEARLCHVTDPTGNLEITDFRHFPAPTW